MSVGRDDPADRVIGRRAVLRGAALASGLVATAAVPGAAGADEPGRLPIARRHGPETLLGWLELLVDRVRHERASPPSAARIYGACAVAGYEAVVAGAPGHRSLAGQLVGLGPVALPPQRGRLDWRAAVNAAVAHVATAAFADRSDASVSAIATYAAGVHAELLAREGAAARRGARHGTEVGRTVAAWLASDGYAQILGLPYEPPVGPSLWVRTPPNFGAAIEPHWSRVRPFAMPSADAVRPPPPVPYSEVPGSGFHAQAVAVLDASSTLTDRQRETAMYWRDNPDGVTGLPSGHWMQIAAVVARRHDLVRAAEVLALVGVSLADAFTSCWTEKYRTNLLRPVTYIDRVIEPGWASFVNSPAFPEYTSGHSVGSAAAARTLTHLAGTVAFTDEAAASRGFAPRSYSSFQEAADEAAASRLVGGIHYPMGIEAGLVQGAAVAELVRRRVRTRRG